MTHAPNHTRRSVLQTGAAAVAGAVVGCNGDAQVPIGTGSDGSGGAGGAGTSSTTNSGAGGAGGAPPTPPCPETENNALGPAYLAGAPMRDDLNPLGEVGTPLRITGRVRDTSCTPVPGALLDLWQADASGVYDGSPIDPDGDPAPSASWRFRGRLYADAQGHYAFRTLYPGLYTGRTRHIHVTVTADGYASLTTQVYFAGVPENASDGLIEPELVIELTDDGSGGLEGVFDVVLGPAA